MFNESTGPASRPPTVESIVAALQAARAELCEVAALEDADRAYLAARAKVHAEIRLGRLTDEVLLLWSFDYHRSASAYSIGRTRCELEAEIAVLEQMMVTAGRAA